MMYIWKSENNLWESVLSFYHMGSRIQTQVIRLVASTLTHLSNLTHPGNCLTASELGGEYALIQGKGEHCICGGYDTAMGKRR